MLTINVNLQPLLPQPKLPASTSLPKISNQSTLDRVQTCLNIRAEEEVVVAPPKPLQFRVHQA
jgi:hypothetical protein